MGNKRMAILVGCNYPNTPNELHGCTNDVLSMREILVNLFQFDPKNIELLIDAPADASIKPTGANIMQALHRMVNQAEPGDVLFLHYSGHGTRIRSKHGFRHDEAIVPCDLNLITDVDFRELVNRLPEKASFTIISDSCHSGGLIDKEKEQIGPDSLTNSTTPDHHRPKTITAEEILAHLKALSGIRSSSSDVGVHLIEIFGNKASKKYLARNDGALPFPGSIHPDSGILLSGCQANETSADVKPTGQRGKPHGAFSNALQMALKESNGRTISNKELVIRTRRILEGQGFNQHPCLYCSDGNADTPFLCMPTSSNCFFLCP